MAWEIARWGEIFLFSLLEPTEQRGKASVVGDEVGKAGEATPAGACGSK